MAVVLREKKLKSGNVSLFLDINIKGKRYKEYLNIIIRKPQSSIDREQNKEMKNLADQIRAKKELELANNDYGFIPAHRKNIDFVKYYQNTIDNYPNRDIRIIKYSLSHFTDFINLKGFNNSILGKQITEDLCRQFKTYLDNKLNGETPYNYFAKFKYVLKRAVKEKIIFSNPAEDIKNIKSDGLKKDILNINEISKLAQTELSNKDVKMAFLFSLNTGLRFCEVKSLQWKNIDNDKMIINQSKTKGTTQNAQKTIDLNKTCLSILQRQHRDNKDSLIFNLPSHTGCLKLLRNWTKRAEIDKHITWHCARHSFAVNLLNPEIARADIKTVSGLLGHSSLKHTEKYTRFLSELQKNAVNNLPEINI